MARFDLKIAGGTIATSADVVRAGVGVRGGRIIALGDDLGPAEETLDARGKLVLPCERTTGMSGSVNGG